jgi:hypothetical protein
MKEHKKRNRKEYTSRSLHFFVVLVGCNPPPLFGVLMQALSATQRDERLGEKERKGDTPVVILEREAGGWGQ